MKRILLFFCVITIGTLQFAIAQNVNTSSDDFNRIALNVFMPEQTEKMPEAATGFLRDKVSQILSNYGLSGNNSNERFIVVPVLSIVSKEITPTSPVMTILEMQVSLYIGDGVEGTKFSGITLSLKGVGSNETKAYNDALKKMKTKDQTLQDFIENGKKKILEYYNAKCDFILSDAQSLSSQNNLDGAIYMLSQVPTVCKECYTKVNNLAQDFYKKNQERLCKIKLSQAENLWSANPNQQGAQQAAELLNEIDPETSCFEYARVLMKNIKTRIQNKIEADELFQRKIQLLEMKNSAELEKVRISALRDISVAYAKSKPTNIVYNVRGWW